MYEDDTTLNNYTTTSSRSTYGSSSELSPAESGAVIGAMLVVWAIYFAVIIVMVVSMWKLFVKAGKPGWAALVPFYNTLVQLEIVGRPAWWLVIMLFVPFFGLWVGIVMLIDVAKSYGKSTGYGIFLAALPVIAFPMLAFSKNTKYVGPVAKGLEGFMPAPDHVAQSTPNQPAN